MTGRSGADRRRKALAERARAGATNAAPALSTAKMRAADPLGSAAHISSVHLKYMRL
jgi:hypothetical protein